MKDLSRKISVKFYRPQSFLRSHVGLLKAKKTLGLQNRMLLMLSESLVKEKVRKMHQQLLHNARKI